MDRTKNNGGFKPQTARVRRVAAKGHGPRRGRAAIGPAIILLLLFSCSPAEKGDDAGGSVRRIFPEVQEEAGSERSSPPAVNRDELEHKPKVPLDASEKLIQVINANLDLDTNDEQILVLRGKDDPRAPLKLAVIDYDPVRASYSRTWESLTNAMNLRLLEISLKDVVGDHNLEIVCRGMNERGELTLDIFRKTPSPTGLGLYFNEILRIVSDGTIEIVEVERSEGYRLGQKNGPSFVINSFSQDRESQNILDRIKRAYNWQYQSNRYVLTATEKLPGAAVEEKQLRELFSDNSVAAFEEFLAGPWYLSGSDGREEILLFLPFERRLSIYSGQVQEVFDWPTSFRTSPNRLLVFGTNESIESITKHFFIEVASLKTIDVSIVGSEQWDRSFGRYLKLSEELQQHLLSEERARIRHSTVLPKGLYRSGAGIEIIFEPPHFTWIEERRQFSGGFSVISLDRDVLYLQGMDENGLLTETATYIMEYSEKQEGNYLYRSLALTPGRTSVRGVEATAETRLVFEQLEILEAQAQPSGKP